LLGLSADAEAAGEKKGCAFIVKQKMRNGEMLKREMHVLKFIDCIWFSEPVAELQSRNWRAGRR
jgi:hypothetical protein